MEDIVEQDESSGQLSKRPYSQHFGANIELFGDKTTLTQVVLLLSYIRHFIQTRTSGTIEVSVGKNMNPTEAFTFVVNGEEVPQAIARKKLEIN